MVDDLASLCLLGMFLILALALLPRLMRSLNRPQTYADYPRYDDPDIQGRGSFGPSQGSESPRYDDPDIQGRGSFGRSGGSTSSGSTSSSGSSRRSPLSGLGRSSSSSGRRDSPNIRGRGSFGRSRK